MLCFSVTMLNVRGLCGLQVTKMYRLSSACVHLSFLSRYTKTKIVYLFNYCLQMELILHFSALGLRKGTNTAILP